MSPVCLAVEPRHIYVYCFCGPDQIRDGVVSVDLIPTYKNTY